MSRFSFLNETRFRIYTYKYKVFYTPITVIFVCIILFVTFIIPQAQQWFRMQEQIAISQQRLEVLTKNLNFAGKINSGAVDSYLQLVTNALPTDKDFIGVLAAISNAAIDSAISLNDYTFQVGELGSGSQSNVSSLQVTVTINGGMNDLTRFIVSLKKQLPLSDVTDIHLDSDNLASLTLNFYYKPFPEKVSFQPAQPLQTLSSKEQLLLENLIALNSSSQKSALSAQEKLIEQ